MLRPEIKRVLSFEQMKGKVIEEIRDNGFSLRILFCDGTFVELSTEIASGPKIVIAKGKQRRSRPFH